MRSLEDPVEIKLGKRMEFCYIEGTKKKGSKNALAPIWFTKESVVGIRLLLKHKSIMGIDPTNKYSFENGYTTKNQKQKTNVKMPALLTPTCRIIFLATLPQLIDINDAEFTWLTNHLGYRRGTFSMVHQYKPEPCTL